MTGGRIGGNVADITDTAGVMTDTGGSAMDASSQASSFASTMEGEITDVTNALNTHFNQMADTLRQQIAQAKQRLAATDWEGTSQAEATEAEAALNADVDAVLNNALTSTEEFKTYMMARSNDFVSMVDGDFRTIMANVDNAYRDLARASQTFAENLQTADQTVKFSR